METINININFGGFYDSIHSDNIDWYIDQEYAYYLEWVDEKTIHRVQMTQDQWNDDVLYSDTKKSYCESYVDRLNKKLDLDLKYIGLDSPKYYNFTTDKIIAKIDMQFAVNNLLPITYDKNFLNWANPFLKSRDGFRSFYNGIEDLIIKAMDNDTEFEILMGLIVDWLIDYHCINEEIYDLEYDLYFNEFTTT